MVRKMISDLRAGEPLDDLFLLSGCELRSARNDSLYLDLTLSDRSGSIKARMWDASQTLFSALAVDQIVRVKGRVELYRNEAQVNVNSITKPDPAGIQLSDFLPEAARPPQEMQQELEALLAKEVKDADYAALLNAFIKDREFMALMRMAPAAANYHHAYLGGLIEHTLSMAKAAALLAGHYQTLRKDLLLTGVFLHDIGKVRELDWQRSFQYTDLGQLVGHVVEGVVMVEERVRALRDFPREKLNLIRHAILSHHGEYEFGSPKLPMTAEAIVLHYLDNLDAKLRDFAEAIATDANGNPNWTGYIPRLQRRLYKK